MPLDKRDTFYTNKIINTQGNICPHPRTLLNWNNLIEKHLYTYLLT